MKILVISQYFWPENFRVNDLVSRWKQDGHDIDVLTGKPNFPGGEIYSDYKKNPDIFKEFSGAKIYRVPLYTRKSGSKFDLTLNYVSFFFCSILFSFFKLRKKKYDLIFTFATSPVTIGLIAIFLSKFNKAKTVIWVLDLWPEIILELNIITNKYLFNILKKIVDYIYKQTDIIYVQSVSFFNEISKIVNIDKIHLLHSWPEIIDYNSEIKAKNIDIDPSYFNIFFTGTIGETQNFEELIDGMELIRDKKVRLIIIGDGRKRKWLQRTIIKKNIKNIEWLPSVPLLEVPSYIQHADALLVSLKSGKVGSFTIPGKFSTYLNFKKPILCHANGEIKRITDDGHFGLTSEPGKVNELVNNILRLKILKDENKIKNFFNKNTYHLFNFDESYKKLNLILLNLSKSQNIIINLIKEIDDIPFHKNFILSGLNLAFLGSFIKDNKVFGKNMFHWPDGLFATRFYKRGEIKKISGRDLINNLKIPKDVEFIHVLGDLGTRAKDFLIKRYGVKIKHSNLPFGNVEVIIKSLPKVEKNELVMLTLPTPKQEYIALKISQNNDNYRIFCIGGALNMLSGQEKPVPKYLEKYFEGIWRLKYETKRRTFRLIFTFYHYFYGELTNKFKKITWKIYKD